MKAALSKCFVVRYMKPVNETVYETFDDSKGVIDFVNANRINPTHIFRIMDGDRPGVVIVESMKIQYIDNAILVPVTGSANF